MEMRRTNIEREYGLTSGHCPGKSVAAIRSDDSALGLASNSLAITCGAKQQQCWRYKPPRNQQREADTGDA